MSDTYRATGAATGPLGSTTAAGTVANPAANAAANPAANAAATAASSEGDNKRRVVRDKLQMTGLRAGYGHLEILRGVDLLIESGEFVTLLGPNGAGKSSLLKTLFGMTTHKGGETYWKGKRISGLPSHEILKRGIAYVPQGRCNFPMMSVAENLELATFTVRDTDKVADREYVYDLFPILRSRRDQFAGNLSGGEQQLLEMAMAVLRHPEILLIDEPSVGLSPQATTIVFDELKRLHEAGKTIVLVEQNTKRAMAYAERAIVLRLGQVIWDSPVADLSHAHLGELFMQGNHGQRADQVSGAVVQAALRATS